MRSFALTVSFSLLALALNNCTPTTPYRNSAMAPAARPIPFDGRTAEKGSLRVDGSIQPRFRADCSFSSVDQSCASA